MARSCRVGMLKGRSLPFFLGIYIRRNGCGRYPRRFRFCAAAYFCLSVLHSLLSTPGVFAPLFSGPRLTAKSLAERECVSSHDKAFALPYFPARIAFAIRNCSLLTTCRILGQLTASQSDTLLEDAPANKSTVICFSSSRMVRRFLLQRET